MRLHQLKPAAGSRPPKRIVGRGEGSTLGQTCGKGQKGQTCRSGDGIMNGFEGGQTPMHRRIPKRGFTSLFRVAYTPINLELLDIKFSAGDEVTGKALFEKGILSDQKKPFKILATGKITKALKITAPKFSKSAQDAVKKAGGSLTNGK